MPEIAQKNEIGKKKKKKQKQMKEKMKRKIKDTKNSKIHIPWDLC